jgi:putative ABC transport system ATP-binding protein
VSADPGARGDGAPVLEARGLEKTFRRGPEVVHAVRPVSFALAPGEVIGLVGPSGSGKTTLLNLLAGWERADAGSLRFRGVDVIDPAALAWTDVTIVPQDLALVEELSILENVTLPLRLAGSDDDVFARAAGIVDELGLGEVAARLPADASLGEQQRTSVARAIVVRPALALADEPTGHQDERSTEAVMRAVRAAADEGTAWLVATHDPDAMPYLDRLLSIRDGELAEAGTPR